MQFHYIKHIISGIFFFYDKCNELDIKRTSYVPLLFCFASSSKVVYKSVAKVKPNLKKYTPHTIRFPGGFYMHANGCNCPCLICKWECDSTFFCVAFAGICVYIRFDTNGCKMEICNDINAPSSLRFRVYYVLDFFSSYLKRKKRRRKMRTKLSAALFWHHSNIACLLACCLFIWVSICSLSNSMKL